MEFGLLQVWEGGWLGAIARGATVTIAVALVSIACGFVVGLACGLIKWGRVRPLNYVVDCYTALVRGIPELLIIYLLFFGSVEFVTRIAVAFGYTGFAESGYSFVIAVIAIGAISGAYSTEVFRGALASVPKGHIEAARALGMSSARIFYRVIAPQMFRVAIPGMSNVWQVTVKDTALVSVVGLQELMRTAFIASNTTRHPFIFYLIAAVVFLLITLASQAGIDWAEKHLRLRTRKS